MKKSKKILSLILAMFIVISVFPMSAVAAGEYTHPFTDLANPTYDPYVEFVYVNGLMNGTAETAFSPEVSLNRAMFVTILYRFQGEPAVDHSYLVYTDVPADSWYTDSVAWATEFGIVNGTSPTTFSPETIINREQTFAILFRYMEAFYSADRSAARNDLSTFTDRSSVSTWAIESTQWAVAVGLNNGFETNRLRPLENLTRINIAIILSSLFDYLGDVVPVDGKALTIQVIGNGTVTVAGNNKSFSAGRSAIKIPTGNTANITMTAPNNGFISFFTVDNGTPTYLGYNTNGTAGYTAWDSFTHSLNMSNDHTIRVYFIQDGTDENLVNPTDSTRSGGYVNYGRDTVLTFATLEAVFGSANAELIMKSGYDTSSSPRGIILNGRCFGISAITAMVSQPAMSGITAASFSRDGSYTIPSQINGTDVSTSAGNLTLLEMVDRGQLLSMQKAHYNTGEGLQILLWDPKLTGNVEQYSSANWAKFFAALDNYENNHSEAVILHITGTIVDKNDGAAHAMLATGYSTDASGNITVFVKDPNGTISGVDRITMTNLATDGTYDIREYTYDSTYYDFTRLYYITTSRIIDFWNGMGNYIPTADGASALANIQVENGNLNGIIISNDNGDSISFENNSISTNLDLAVIENVYGDFDDDFSSKLMWMPIDTYTIVNTKDTAITVMFSTGDGFSTITIDPLVTATFNMSSNVINFNSNAPAFASVKNTAYKSAADGFSSIEISGIITTNGASAQCLESSTIATGFTSLDVVCVDEINNVITNTCDINGFENVTISAEDASITSDESTIEQNITQTVFTQQLATPSGISFANCLASWDAVAGASYYRIGIYESGTLLGCMKDIAETSFDFSPYVKNRDVSYTFTVQAMTVGDTGYYKSSVATSPSYTMPTIYLPAPTNVIFNYSTATWSAVDGAIGYEVTLYSNGSIIDTIITKNTSYNFKNTFPARATYYFSVKALGDDITTFSSEEVYSYNYHYSPKLSSADELLITAIDTEGGWITPGTKTVKYGKQQMYTIHPEKGYYIVDVLIDGVSMGSITKYQFTNVVDYHTITAIFAPK